jgi:hypothetical protein
MELSKINRNLNLIKRARQLDSKKHFKLLNSDLISWLQSSQINLYCVDQDYFLDNFKMDFSLSYNLILIHELGHYLAYCQNDFSENGAWVQGLKLSKKLNFFSPELADWFTNYFIV